MPWSSVDEEASKVTRSPARGEGGLNENAACGGVLRVTSRTFEMGDQFGTSSAVRRANQYRVPGVSPTTVSDSADPAAFGAVVGTWVAVRKFDVSNGPALERRRSYVDAVPVTPSSPGAVHCRETLWVPVGVARMSVVCAGGVPSGV